MSAGEMIEKKYETPYGVIHYWTTQIVPERITLIFLPGLTADRRLFDRQLEYFRERYNCLLWDAPGHGKSRPFELKFSLEDKAEFLQGIMEREHINKPVLIGQSMGGYVAQAFMERYPDRVSGFISIDSCPLQRRYATGMEIWLLKRMEPMYLAYPWKNLIKAGSSGCADSEYGRELMREMMQQYGKEEYCRLAGHGYRMLADAYASNRPYKLSCPSLLICGENDRAGSAKRYNRNWAKREGLPIFWIKNAGHNSNTDQPDRVNSIIENFIRRSNHD